MINRFDTVEKAVVALLNCGASESMDELGKLVRATKSKVFRSVKKAERFGLFGPAQPFVNYAQLGLTSYWVYVNFGCENESVINQLKGRIQAAKTATSAYLTGGSYHLLLVLTLSSPGLLNSELDTILDLPGVSHADFSVLTQIHSTFFGRRYLAPHLDLGAPCETQMPARSLELTRLESKLIATMLKRQTINASEIGRFIDVSPSTCIRCMRSLEDRKIISGYIRDLDTNAFSVLRFSLLIRATGSPSLLIKRLDGVFRREKAVVSITEFIGSKHLEIQCEVERNFEIPALTQRIFYAAGASIQDIEVIPVLSTLKFRTFPID
jgi:DNA-binding Lrp family transcriptional regulator